MRSILAERQHNDHHSAFRTPSSMPRSSERQQFIVEIIDFLAILIPEDDDDEDLSFCTLQTDGTDLDMDTPAEELAELLQFVIQNRYLVPRERIPLSSDFAYNVFPRLSDEDFKQQTRTTRSTFSKILTAIQGHNIFSNASQNPQAPVWLQLAVALDRLGTNGNGAFLGRSRKLWGLEKGTVPLYTARVIIALNDPRDEFVV
ncbi:hypothetical protein PHMEG_00017930 [Phytophthora megakarya]|uniref:Uncharacterized protein n=1 Tax=Phytophthora megakarya TaxID=4795 RepID=A0A225VWU8_9STRA|nr:hypothetical protein PHMEG_00017930 [Phytophthora megakarya]